MAPPGSWPPASKCAPRSLRGVPFVHSLVAPPAPTPTHAPRAQLPYGARSHPPGPPAPTLGPASRFQAMRRRGRVRGRRRLRCERWRFQCEHRRRRCERRKLRCEHWGLRREMTRGSDRLRSQGRVGERCRGRSQAPWARKQEYNGRVDPTRTTTYTITTSNTTTLLLLRLPYDYYDYYCCYYFYYDYFY